MKILKLLVLLGTVLSVQQIVSADRHGPGRHRFENKTAPDVDHRVGTMYLGGFELVQLDTKQQAEERPPSVEPRDQHPNLGQDAEALPVVAVNVSHTRPHTERTVLDRTPAGFFRLLERFSRRRCWVHIDEKPLSGATLAGFEGRRGLARARR